MNPSMMPPMPPQGGASRQPKYTLKDTKEVSCPQCGSLIFKEAFMLRTLSRIMTGESKDTLVTVPIVVCDSCGAAFQEMLPEELKTPKISV
jgi:uncharacterized Zn finger protein